MESHEPTTEPRKEGQKRAAGRGQSVTVVCMLRTKRNKRETTNRKDKGKGGLGEGLPQAKMEPDRGEKVAGKAENPGSHGRKMTVQSQNAGVFPMQDAGSGLHIAKKGGIDICVWDL